MKISNKLISTILFLINLNCFCLGQDYKWSDWQQISCFKGISYQVGGKPWPSGGFVYVIKIRNSYNRKVSFSYDWDLSSQKSDSGFRRESIQTKGESRITGTEKFVDKEGSWTFNVERVCFDPNDYCSNYNNPQMCFAECDNGTPIIPNCKGNVNNQSSNNSYPNSNRIESNSVAETNAEIKNLNIYLTKIADSNIEKQRIIQDFNNIKNLNLSDSQKASQIRELTSRAQNLSTKLENNISEKTGTYMDFYQKATEAGKAGNCDEAISNWKSAIAIAVNDAQRDNAQQWLNEVIKAKNSGQCKSVTNSTISSTTNLSSNSTQMASNAAERANAERAAATGAAVVALGAAAAGIVMEEKRLKAEERELYNKLVGKESIYPEAILYFKDYKKYNKTAKNIRVLAYGATIIGLGMMLSTVSSIGYGDSSDKIFNAGVGVTIGGPILALLSIPASVKAKRSYTKANDLVTRIGFNPSGFSLCVNF